MKGRELHPPVLLLFADNAWNLSYVAVTISFHDSDIDPRFVSCGRFGVCRLRFEKVVFSAHNDGSPYLLFGVRGVAPVATN